MNQDFDIVVTKNPLDITGNELKRIAEQGGTIVRINGSFLQTDNYNAILPVIKKARQANLETLLDLPGFKPRFTHLEKTIHYQSGIPMSIPLSSINYPDIISHMEPGDVIRINDGMIRLSIENIKDNIATFIPDCSGKLLRGKGFYLEKRGYRPEEHCLSKLDIELIEMAKKTGIDFVGVSFVHNLHDLEIVDKMLQKSSTGFIPKIEARASLELENLIPILANCEKVIIDRGDMSGEMGLETIWYYQRRVLDMAKIFNCKVIMATQFLTSMLYKPLPSIAEIDSLYDLLDFGIDGVQLSEETCVGDHGNEVIQLIKNSRSTKYEMPNPQSSDGNIIWIMGPTSSGKTTLAEALTKRLSNSKIPVWHYDGDEVRNLLGSKLGFGSNGRLTVVKTLVHVADKASRAGHNVVVSALTANEDARKIVNEQLSNLSIIYLDCPIDVCSKRDPKGLYKKAGNKEIDTLIGFNTAYNKPEKSDLILDTSQKSIEECTDELVNFLIFSNHLKCWG